MSMVTPGTAKWRRVMLFTVINLAFISRSSFPIFDDLNQRNYILGIGECQDSLASPIPPALQPRDCIEVAGG